MLLIVTLVLLCIALILAVVTVRKALAEARQAQTVPVLLDA